MVIDDWWWWDWCWMVAGMMVNNDGAHRYDNDNEHWASLLKTDSDLPLTFVTTARHYDHDSNHDHRHHHLIIIIMLTPPDEGCHLEGGPPHQPGGGSPVCRSSVPDSVWRPQREQTSQWIPRVSCCCWCWCCWFCCWCCVDVCLEVVIIITVGAWVNGRTEEWMEGWMDGWMDGWIDWSFRRKQTTL